MVDPVDHRARGRDIPDYYIVMCFINTLIIEYIELIYDISKTIP